MVDYYEILEVDPRADPSAIDAALRRWQPVWSSGTRNPKTKHQFQSYLDEIPRLRRALLSGPAARADYDADRLAALRARRETRLDDLQRLVRLRAAKGGLTPSDRALLATEATRLGLTHGDLDRLVGPIPSRVDEAAPLDAPEPTPDILDPVARKQIRVTLDHLRRRDLYDVLGLSRDASAAAITSRADDERRRWMQKSQVTAEKTAWLEAVSHAQSHLIPLDARARYDRTLRHEAEERLSEAIGFATRGLPRLDYGTRSALVAEGAAGGIDAERASALIVRGCRALGVACDPPTGLLNGSVDPPRYLRCRSCAGVTAFDDVAGTGGNPATVRAECPHCGASLRWHCPGCGRDHWADIARCGVCGFRRDEVETLARLLAEAQAAGRDRDYRRALDLLERVRGLVPDHPGARKGIRAAQSRLVEAEQAQAAYEGARSRRHLDAATAALGVWAQLAPLNNPEVGAATRALDSDRRVVEALLARAEGSLGVGDLADARLAFDQALALAADRPEVRRARLRVPPDPPAGLVARFGRDRVRLRWSPAPAERPDLGPVRYLVVRRSGGIPTSVSDGRLVAETAQSEAEDATVAPGDRVGYAVFASRGKAIQPIGASSPLVDALGEVTDLGGEVESGAVRLRWRLPPGAIAARVVRRDDRPPIDPRDGTPLPARPDGLLDQGLSDDRAYYYAVFCQFPPLAGVPAEAERLSRGVPVTLVPRPPATAVAAPGLAVTTDGRVLLSWPGPPRGEVKVYRTTGRPLPFEPGDSVPVGALTGGTWIEPTGPGRAEDGEPPASGLGYYAIVVTLGGEATIGHPARYSGVADPSDLRAVRVGGVGGSGRVHLRWRWSPQGAESRVVAVAGRPPVGADDPEGIACCVGDDEYGRLGYLAITLPTATEAGEPIVGPWHLAVYAVAIVGGEEVVSPGLEPSSRTILPGPNPEVTLSYAWKRSGLVGRAWSLTFRTEPPGAAIPPTALVTHPRTVPLSADDGSIVARFPASVDGASFAIPTPGADLARGHARIFADPTADPEGLAPIRIRHPDAATRV